MLLTLEPVRAAGYMLGAALISLAVSTDTSDGHEGMGGWTYPHECCHDRDCHEVSEGEVSARPDGFLIQETGEVIPYTDDRVRNSPDGRYHLCVVMYEIGPYTSCLFTPPQSF